MKFKHFLQYSPWCLLFSLSVSHAADWDEKYYNPKPLEDDVILPMPCEGSMVFRKVSLPLASPLEDKSIVLGQDSSEWGYIEQSRPSHIAGSFSEKQNSRYYLIAKYELSELQYQAIMASECPKPSMKQRLPAVSYSWMEGIQAADHYNLWLRQHAMAQLPIEDGEPGFVRLPTEEEWEFAARGGLAVDTAQFRDARYPMPEGINNYEWFAGPQSANGKLQLSGLLSANPLGLHDMLGNADEMMLEPFRLNKLNRLHGQAGGVVIRGSNILSPQAELRTSARKEAPYYRDQAQAQNKYTGMRFVLVSSTLTSRERVLDIEKAWQKLGMGTAQDGNAESVQALQSISAKLEDEALKKQLKKLENELRSSNEKQAEARNQAILASLNLGAFLCTKLKDDGHHVLSLQNNYDNLCEAGQELDQHCPTRLSRIQDQESRLEGVKSYYASSLIDSALLYGDALIRAQVPVMQETLKTNKRLISLSPFVNVHWQHQEQYLKSQHIDTELWLQNCMAINK